MTRVHRAAAALTVFGLLMASAPSFAGGECSDPLPAGQLRLQVAVSGVKNNRGNITVTVYADDARQFLAKGGKLARQRVPTRAPVTTACFQLPMAEYYAVAVYHDADDDHDLGRNLLGLPSEGYGFSNNPDTLIGLPSLDKVRVPVHAGDNPVAIRLKY